MYEVSRFGSPWILASGLWLGGCGVPKVYPILDEVDAAAPLDAATPLDEVDAATPRDAAAADAGASDAGAP